MENDKDISRSEYSDGLMKWDNSNGDSLDVQKLEKTVRGRQLKIEKENSEELESSVDRIRLLRRSILGTGLFTILSILSLGLFYVFTKWFDFIWRKMCFRETYLGRCNYIELKSDDGKREVVPIKKDPNIESWMFSYRFQKFFLVMGTLSFKPIKFSLETKTHLDIYSAYSKGIESDNVLTERSWLYGTNQTEVPVKSHFAIFLDEVLSAFYFFQWWSCGVWFIDDYYIYAGVILIMSLFSIITTIFETRNNMLSIQKMSYYETDIQVKRNGAWSTIKSSGLVPGDLILIPQEKAMPCDVLLLTGSAIMNESMLTGESIPVVKNALAKTNNTFNEKTQKQSILFSGTICLQARTMGEKNVRGIVISTGFATQKGNMIRSIIYPKPFFFRFDRDSTYYLLILTIVCIIGFIWSTYYLLKYKLGISIIVIKGMELFTNAIPPALPTCMSIGIQFALSRMKEKNIFCTHPNRVNVAGRIRILCLDKTGTLTEEGLAVHALAPIDTSNGQVSFGGPFENTDKVLEAAKPLEEKDERSKKMEIEKSTQETLDQLFLEGLAVCHSLTRVNGKLIGDPLDVKMFEGTGWEMEESDLDRKERMTILSNGNHNDHVSELSLAKFTPSNRFFSHFKREATDFDLWRRFDFVPALQRMSVIVRCSGDPEETFRVYIKGSPEKLRELCIPESIPEDFTFQLSISARKGYRVLAIGVRTMRGSYADTVSMVREEAENSFTFLGLLILENKLKPVTTKTIGLLHEADLRTVMITGDNVLTAVAIAKECGIVPAGSTVYLGDLSEKTKELQWADFMTEEKFDPYTLPPRKSKKIKMCKSEPVFAITSRGFDVLNSQFERALKMKDEEGINRFYLILDRLVVFARMQPDGKVLAVSNLQKRYEMRNLLVGFCGDGANDCAALKAADIGISLSEAEASVAAPFTSKIQDITAIVKVLREGRAALSTSFQSFKYMAFYAMAQFSGVLFSYLYFQEYTDPEYLYVDLFLVLPFALFMTRHGAYKKLTKVMPSHSLMTPQALVSTFGNIFITQYFFFIGLFYVNDLPGMLAQVPNQLSVSSKPHYPNMIVFLFSNTAFTVACIVFTKGYPFRKPAYFNLLFTFWSILIVGLNSYLTLMPCTFIVEFGGLTTFGWKYSWQILGLQGCLAFVMIVFEAGFVSRVMPALGLK